MDVKSTAGLKPAPRVGLNVLVLNTPCTTASLTPQFAVWEADNEEGAPKA
jgi:hypothetical protein